MSIAHNIIFGAPPVAFINIIHLMYVVQVLFSVLIVFTLSPSVNSLLLF